MLHYTHWDSCDPLGTREQEKVMAHLLSRANAYMPLDGRFKYVFKFHTLGSISLEQPSPGPWLVMMRCPIILSSNFITIISHLPACLRSIDHTRAWTSEWMLHELRAAAFQVWWLSAMPEHRASCC